MRAGDMVRVSEDPRRLQAMADDVGRVCAKDAPRIVAGKLRFWSSLRLAKIRAQVTTLDAQDALQVLGLSVATRRTPEGQHRIDRTWAVLREQRSRLISESLVARVKWLRWMQHVPPVLSYRSCCPPEARRNC